MKATATIRRRIGILPATALRDLAAVRCQRPKLESKFQSLIQCAECGGKISEGRPGRRCQSCREKSIVWRN